MKKFRTIPDLLLTSIWRPVPACSLTRRRRKEWFDLFSAKQTQRCFGINIYTSNYLTHCVKPATPLILLLVFCLGTVLNATLIEEKISLENSIRQRAMEIIEKILGNTEVIISVGVELDLEEEKKEEKKKEIPIYPGMDLGDVEYLPGITYKYLPTESPEFSTKKVVIKKISLIVTVDQNTTTLVIDRIKKELLSLLGLDTNRGDTIAIEKIIFSKPKPTFRDFYHSWSGLFYWFGTLIFLTLFFLGPLRIVLRNIAKTMEMRVDAETRIRSMEQVVLPGVNPGQIALPQGGALELTLDRRRRKKEEEEEVLKKRFGFINESNIKNLIFLLKKEPAEKIAIVISYLPAESATQIIDSLTPEQQKEVFRNLSTARIFSPDEVGEVEHELKTNIDYLIGGENYFSKIFDDVDRATQENILGTLMIENPALAEKLRRQLFYFENIVELDKTAIQKMIRLIQQRGDINLALALKSAPEDIKVTIMDTLTEGARAILAEQMDLLGDTSSKRVEEEQRIIVGIVKELIKAGEILFNRE